MKQLPKKKLSMNREAIRELDRLDIVHGGSPELSIDGLGNTCNTCVCSRTCFTQCLGHRTCTGG